MEGAKVVICARGADRLQSAADDLVAEGFDPAHILARACDVLEGGQVEALGEAALQAFGRVDILVCNAGQARISTFEGTRDGQNVVEITLRPKPEAPVVWGKLVITARAADNMPIREDYFDEELKPVRIMYLSDIKVLGGRKLPTVQRVVPADKPSEFTELTYERLEFDLPLEDSYFSISQLRRR